MHVIWTPSEAREIKRIGETRRHFEDSFRQLFATEIENYDLAKMHGRRSESQPDDEQGA